PQIMSLASLQQPAPSIWVAHDRLHLPARQSDGTERPGTSWSGALRFSGDFHRKLGLPPIGARQWNDEPAFCAGRRGVTCRDTKQTRIPFIVPLQRKPWRGGPLRRYSPFSATGGVTKHDDIAPAARWR